MDIVDIFLNDGYTVYDAFLNNTFLYDGYSWYIPERWIYYIHSLMMDIVDTFLSVAKVDTFLDDGYSWYIPLWWI